MSWHVLSSVDVLSEFTPQEQAALKNIQQAVDNVPAILGRAVAGARGAIRAGGYALDANAATTPDQIDSEIVAIARWKWLVSFPQLKALQTPERKAAHDDAQKRLDAISRQEVSVEPPTAGVNSPTGNWNSENKLVMRTHPTPRPSAQQGDQATPYANPTGPADS